MRTHLTLDRPQVGVSGDDKHTNGFDIFVRESGEQPVLLLVGLSVGGVSHT